MENATSPGVTQNAPAENQEIAKAITALATKPSFKTGEFSLVAAFIIGAGLLALSHAVNGNVAAICSGAAALTFSTIRTNHKSAMLDKLIDTLESGKVVPDPVTAAKFLGAVEAGAKSAAISALTASPAATPVAQ